MTFFTINPPFTLDNIFLVNITHRTTFERVIYLLLLLTYLKDSHKQMNHVQVPSDFVIIFLVPLSFSFGIIYCGVKISRVIVKLYEERKIYVRKKKDDKVCWDDETYLVKHLLHFVLFDIDILMNVWYFSLLHTEGLNKSFFTFVLIFGEKKKF